MINNSVYRVTEIPDFHPIAQRYERLQWWREQKRRCIEGYWVGGKWMPPELYYYVNFHNIKFEDDGGTAVSIGLPWLRDLEWEKAYIYTEACGFSGFEEDTLHTCHRWYGPEKERALKYGWITQEDLKKKVYVPAREYLRRIHPANLGKPLYYNAAKNVIDLEGRGGGKSYWASGMIAHNFLFDGARDYDKYLFKFRDRNEKPYASDTVVGAIDAKYSTDLLSKVKLAFENYPGSANIINNYGEQETHPSPLSKPYTGSMMPSKVVTSSNRSVMKHVTFRDDPLAANGTRPNRCFLEEVGFMNNLIESWGAIEATQAAAQHKRLVIYGLGTGGLTTAGAALYAQEIFYNPDAYNCLVFEDKWENRGEIGYFVPAVFTRNAFKKTENLITDEKLADTMLDEELADAKKSNSRNKLLAYIINNPRKPSEIFLRQEGTHFPVQDLKEALADLEGNKILLKAAYRADLHMPKEGIVEIRPSDKPVITDYPLRKGMPMDACVEIYEKPKVNNSGIVYGSRYIMATDPVDDDGNDDITRSLQSTFVYDTWTDRIVAEYTARTYLAEEYYENVRKLCHYYNARLLYENNKKGLYGHFKVKNSLHLLAESPQILKDQDLVKQVGHGNRSLGVNVSNDRIKLFGINLILKWLEGEAYDDPGLKNLNKIRSIALFKELISFSLDVNADRVSALIVLMIYREELSNTIISNKTKDIKTTTGDDFWGRAYPQFKKDKVYNRVNNLSSEFGNWQKIM